MHQLFIKQKVFKITDHYPVTDENGREVYYVDQDFKLIGNRVTITKISTGEQIFINRELFTLFFPKYTVDFYDGKQIEINQEFALFKKVFSISSNDYDLEVKGDFFDFNFQVYDKDRLVGEIERKWLTWGDTFVITVYDKEFEEELVAILIAIDEIIDRQQRD